MSRAVVIVLLSGVIVTVPSPVAAAPARVTPAAAPGAAAPGAAGADAHLADQVRQRSALVPKAARAESDLRKRLGTAFGGLWIGTDQAVIRVGVTDQAAAVAARAAGAVPVRVRYSLTALNAMQAALDRNAGRAPRSTVGWYVDLPSNTVVVQALAPAVAAAGRFARSTVADPAAIRVVQVAEAPHVLGDLRGGDPFYTPQVQCSIGFAVRTGGFSPAYVTAGHCGTLGTTTTQGYIAASYFPTHDYAWVQADASWTYRPWVNTYSGGLATVAGSQEAPVGSPVCRSGATTGWHCGTILAKNQTVVYTGGNTVYGLTQTNACSDLGDSGGPFITGDQAQGVTSGGTGNCGSGGTTYFQPINPILSAYGLFLAVDNLPRYNLVAVHSGKCLDVADSSVVDGAQIRQWTCLGSGAANQKWRLILVPGTTDTYNLVAWHSGKCADVTGASTADGALVHQWFCSPPGGTNQQWRLVPVPGMANTYNVIAVHSGKCLDVSDASIYDGALVHQWFCSPPGGTNQQWQVVPIT